MDLQISVLGDRPDLFGPMWRMRTSWPEFMLHDPIGNLYYSLAEQFADYVLVAQDPDGNVVAKAFSAPFQLAGEEFFDDGWDGVMRRAVRTLVSGDKPDTISAVEISIRPDLQGGGLSRQMLAAMRANAGRRGFTELWAPVRPNGKQDPSLPMTDYAFRVREQDGLPVDPWLRVHVRAGAEIVRVAPRSMVIPGTLAEWRRWTGLPFDRSGAVEVPFALAPVMVDVEHDHAVYVEPNVWVRHKIAGQ
jgi:GNAT superfamily N-acetyltransferase